MPIKKLEEVVVFKDNLRKPITSNERIEGPYPYYGANGIQGYVNDFIFDEELVLLAEDGGHFYEPDRGIAYKVNGKSWVNNHAHVLSPKSNIDINYLWRVLENLDIKEYVNGTTRAKLTKSNALQIKIPLPPLSEQKRISTILDKANEIKAKRELALAKLDELAECTFREMFGNLFNDASIKLKDVCHRVTDGTHQSPKWESDGIPFLFISNIVENQITLDTNKFISVETYKQLTKNCAIEVGDILYTTVGSYGNVAIVKNENKFCFQRHIALIKPNRKIVTSNFLAVMLRSKFIRQQVDKVAKGVAQKTVNLSDLSKLDIICPSIKEQQKFNKIISEIDSIKNKFTAYKIKSINTINSLQNQAFTSGFNT